MKKVPTKIIAFAFILVAIFSIVELSPNIYELFLENSKPQFEVVDTNVVMTSQYSDHEYVRIDVTLTNRGGDGSMRVYVEFTQDTNTWKTGGTTYLTKFDTQTCTWFRFKDVTQWTDDMTYRVYFEEKT
jgi:hypothetical protein